MSKKKKKNTDITRMRCPYCGGSVVYRSADGIYYDNSKNVMLYVCSHYPSCDAYVRVHDGTNIPVGVMADRKLRALRKEAHRYFDKLHQTGIMSRTSAYMWLADLLGVPRSKAHIGNLGEYYCNEVIRRSREILERKGVISMVR